MTRIKLYDYEAAACPTKVRWALAEEDLAWVRHRVDLAAFEHKTAHYLAVHPGGVVPAATIGGHVFTDADEIMRHIAELTNSGRIMPDRAGAKEAIEGWLSRIREFHRGYGMLLYDEIYVPLQARRSAADRERALSNIADAILRARTESLIEHGLPKHLLDDALQALHAAFQEFDAVLDSQEWLAGDCFSIADIGLFPYVHSPLHRVSDLWFGKLPNLQAWLQRMFDRPAYGEAVTRYPYDEELTAAIAAAAGGGGFRLPTGDVHAESLRAV